ncbi:MAG: hypothetical protein OXD44_06870 [Gammaproteobacteria bacterium]|nr:hypothetical protein [Gammaproteobacteria bacterium]
MRLPAPGMPALARILKVPAGCGCFPIRNIGCGVTVVPITSKRQSSPWFSVRIRSPLDGMNIWTVCNQVNTMSVSRLLPSQGKPLVYEEEYQDVMGKIVENLART